MTPKQFMNLPMSEIAQLPESVLTDPAIMNEFTGAVIVTLHEAIFEKQDREMSCGAISTIGAYMRDVVVHKSKGVKIFMESDKRWLWG